MTLVSSEEAAAITSVYNQLFKDSSVGTFYYEYIVLPADILIYSMDMAVINS